VNTLREMFIAVGVWGLALIAIAIALAIAIYDVSQKPAAARTRSRAGGRSPEPNQFVGHNHTWGPQRDQVHGTGDKPD
jgi:hypothetical protein